MSSRLSTNFRPLFPERYALGEPTAYLAVAIPSRTPRLLSITQALDNSMLKTNRPDHWFGAPPLTWEHDDLRVSPDDGDGELHRNVEYSVHMNTGHGVTADSR